MIFKVWSFFGFFLVFFWFCVELVLRVLVVCKRILEEGFGV